MAPWIQWLRRSWYEKPTILPFWQALGSRCLFKLGVWLHRPSMRCGNLDGDGLGIWVQIWIRVIVGISASKKTKKTKKTPHVCCGKKSVWVSRWLAWLSQTEVLKVLSSRSTSHAASCSQKRLISPSVPWELPDRWVGLSPVSDFLIPNHCGKVLMKLQVLQQVNHVDLSPVRRIWMLMRSRSVPNWWALGIYGVKSIPWKICSSWVCQVPVCYVREMKSKWQICRNYPPKSLGIWIEILPTMFGAPLSSTIFVMIKRDKICWHLFRKAPSWVSRALTIRPGCWCTWPKVQQTFFAKPIHGHWGPLQIAQPFQMHCSYRQALIELSTLMLQVERCLLNWRQGWTKVMCCTSALWNLNFERDIRQGNGIGH